MKCYLILSGLFTVVTIRIFFNILVALIYIEYNFSTLILYS